MLAFVMCYGREFCGRLDQHPYELYLQLEEIDHRTTRAKRPQSNGIIERFHRTLFDEHFRVEGRKTWFETVDEMQAVLDAYLIVYNIQRPHQGRGMNGRTPITVFRAGLPSASLPQKEKSPPQKPRQIRRLIRPAPKRQVSGDYRSCTKVLSSQLSSARRQPQRAASI